MPIFHYIPANSTFKLYYYYCYYLYLPMCVCLSLCLSFALSLPCPPSTVEACWPLILESGSARPSRPLNGRVLVATVAKLRAQDGVPLTSWTSPSISNGGAGLRGPGVYWVSLLCSLAYVKCLEITCYDLTLK